MTRLGAGPYNCPVPDLRKLVKRISAAAALIAAMAILGGCDAMPWFSPKLTSEPPIHEKVPEPIDTLLPAEIIIQAWTGTRVFAEQGGISGIDVRIQAKDSFGEFTKAFGTFRFELYHYQPTAPDDKGERIAVWNEQVLNARQHLQHWEKFLPGYRFKLGSNQPIAIGRKFVLQVTYDSPWTGRLGDEMTFTAGD